jgi:hypothetical protein
METSFQGIRDMVNGASLPAEVKRSVVRSLEQLPPLYREFQQTYDIRHRDGILSRVRGMFYTLGKGGADGPRVMTAIVQQLRAMHERLGVPDFDLKAPKVASTRRSS